MYIDRRTLKAEARRILRSARPHPVLVTLLLLLLTTGLSTLVGLSISTPLDLIVSLTQQGLTPDRAMLIMASTIGPVGLFLHILITVFGLVLSFGYDRWALTASRGEQAAVSDLVYGFSMVGRILWLEILTFGYCLLWSILLFMAGSLLMLIPTLLAPIFSPAMAIVFLCVLLILGYAFLFTRYLRCALAHFILLDEPEHGAFFALRQSIRMMSGQTARLFLLYLSFVGWLLLMIPAAMLAGVLGLLHPILSAAVTLIASVGLELWLTPYVTLTLCRFYDSLPRPQTEQDPFEL